MKSLLVALVVVLFSSTLGAAAPFIEAIEMDEDSPSIATIRGAGFGSFAGEILSWDDFEDHPDDSPLAGRNPVIGHQWSTQYGYSGLGIRTVSDQAATGRKSVKINWSIDRSDRSTIRAFGWAGKGPYTELYISYWRRMEGEFVEATRTGSTNHKQFYLFGNGPNEKPQLMPLLPAGSPNALWGVYNNVGDGSVSYNERNNSNTLGWRWSNTNGVWQRWEFHFRLNSPYTASNGIVRAWLDGRKGIDNDRYRIGYVDGQFKDFRLGHMVQGFPDSAKAWFDDIYIATTPARVELCEAPSYDACTVKHLQVVSSADWTATTITVELRSLEQFSTDVIYMYVVDASGAHSNGAVLRLSNFPAPPGSVNVD